MAKTPTIQWRLLGRALTVALFDKNGKTADLARGAGVSSDVALRALRGQSVSGDSYLKLCAWLNLPPEHFTEGGSQVMPEMSTPDKIETALLHDGKLKQDEAFALSDMMRAAYRAMSHATR